MGVAISRDNGTALSFFLFDDRLEGQNKRSIPSDNGPGRLLGFWKSDDIISDPDGLLSDFLQGRSEFASGEMPIDHVRGPKGFEFVLTSGTCGRNDRRESGQPGELDSCEIG